MNAKEMFGALGYEFRKSDDKIVYFFDVWDDECFIFWVNEREFSVSEYGEPKNVTIDEFKAIQQQLKELGWI